MESCQKKSVDIQKTTDWEIFWNSLRTKLSISLGNRRFSFTEWHGKVFKDSQSYTSSNHISGIKASLVQILFIYRRMLVQVSSIVPGKLSKYYTWSVISYYTGRHVVDTKVYRTFILPKLGIRKRLWRSLHFEWIINPGCILIP